MATKSAIKAAYIAALQATYAFYTEDSRANEAADSALSGKMKLKGACWDAALKANGLRPSITLRELAELPE